MARRHGERHRGGGEGLLRSGDPRLHRGGGNEEGAGDLVAGEAADDAEGQRHPSLPAQHGVARHEHQRQHVVVDPVRVPQQVARVGTGGRRDPGAGVDAGAILTCMPGEGGVPVVEGRTAAKCVDGAPPADREQPPAGMARHAFARPRHERLRERFLCQVLGEREVMGVSREPADDPR